MPSQNKKFEPAKLESLQKALEAKVFEAMRAQRNGDIESYSQFWEEANQINKSLCCYPNNTSLLCN